MGQNNLELAWRPVPLLLLESIEVAAPLVQVVNGWGQISEVMAFPDKQKSTSQDF